MNSLKNKNPNPVEDGLKITDTTSNTMLNDAEPNIVSSVQLNGDQNLNGLENQKKKKKSKNKKKKIETKQDKQPENADLLRKFEDLDMKDSMEIPKEGSGFEESLITPPAENNIRMLDSQDIKIKNEEKPNSNNLAPFVKTNYVELVKKMKEFYIGERNFDGYVLKKEYLENRDNHTKLYHQVLRKSSHTVASVLIVHGACEHSSRYLEVARNFADSQFQVHLFDIRGFGYSSGARVMTSITDIFQDLMLVMTKIQKNNPLFVLGHSMGGATMISFLKLNPHIKIAGVILTNPFVNFPERMKLKFLDRLIIKCLPDTLNSIMLNNEIDPHILTKSESTLNDIWKDRLLNPMVTIKFCKTMIHFSDIVRNFKVKEKFNYSVFFIAGMKDRLTEIDSGCKFFDNFICEDKSFYYFEEGLHEILLDVEKEDTVNIMTEWIFNRLNNAESFGNLTRLPI